MVRNLSVDNNGIRRGAWSEEEDNILKSYVLKHDNIIWGRLPRATGLARCGKSCRLRWKNYLMPGIKRGNYTQEEVKQIIKLREEFGNKWSLIASKLSGRTDNEIKNYWHTHLKNPTKHGMKSIISTHENVENMDQIHVIESTEQINSSSKAIVPFSQPQVSSMISNSMDSIDSFQPIEEFLFNTSNGTLNTQISPSPIYNLESSDEVARSFGTDTFVLDTLNYQILTSTNYDLGLSDEMARRFGSETFMLDPLNTQISPSPIYNLELSDEVARSFGTAPFMLNTLSTQIPTSTISDLGLSDEMARRFGSETFTLDTLNNQILPSKNCDCALCSVDWSSWTQPMLMDTSSNDTIFSSAVSNIEECMAPFMPLATGESDLINLFSAVYNP